MRRREPKKVGLHENGADRWTDGCFEVEENSNERSVKSEKASKSPSRWHKVGYSYTTATEWDVSTNDIGSEADTICWKGDDILKPILRDTCPGLFKNIKKIPGAKEVTKGCNTQTTVNPNGRQGQYFNLNNLKSISFSKKVNSYEGKQIFGNIKVITLKGH